MKKLILVAGLVVVATAAMAGPPAIAPQSMSLIVTLMPTLDQAIDPLRTIIGPKARRRQTPPQDRPRSTSIITFVSTYEGIGAHAYRSVACRWCVLRQKLWGGRRGCETLAAGMTDGVSHDPGFGFESQPRRPETG